jgi:hypothetical protein
MMPLANVAAVSAAEAAAENNSAEIKTVANFISGPALRERVRPVACALLTVRQLIFGHDALDLVRLDAVSETTVRLDRHTLNDGVNLRHIGLYPPLRPLTAMEDFVV